MTGSKRAHFAPLVAILALGIVGLTAPRAHASDICPSDVALCVVINSNATTNDRDDVITLPEALLIANGDLSVSDLTSEEQGQVVLVPPGWGPEPEPENDTFPSLYNPPGFGGPGGIGGASIYFDPDVFCETCGTNRIVLTPPGFGGPGGIGGNSVVLPISDDVSGPRIRIGLAYRGGSEIAAKVIIDGSHLDASMIGLQVNREQSWIRGLTFTGFRGTAVVVAAKSVTIGTNEDGYLDGMEAVHFIGNATDLRLQQ